MLRRRRRRFLLIWGIAVLISSVFVGHLGEWDYWSGFNHRHFHVIDIAGADLLVIETGKNRTSTVRLLGIVAPPDGDVARRALSELARGHDATLLLPTPQTRDEHGDLIASVFVDGANLSVELARAGVVYADRREKTVMSGLIDPAEAEARKKKRGIWEDLKFAQMPVWRQTGHFR